MKSYRGIMPGHRLHQIAESLLVRPSREIRNFLWPFPARETRPSRYSPTSATLIGDKSGPAIVALTYGDVRPDHLLRQAQRIRLTVQASLAGQEGGE